VTWGQKGAWLAAGCVLATVLSPVISVSASRAADGTVRCRVMRHALVMVPFWWTHTGPVLDAASTWTPARQVGRRRGISLSETTNVFYVKAAEPVEWMLYATIGADAAEIATAVDDLVAGKRTEPFFAWQANGVVVFAVFVVALPCAAAMISRPVSDRLGVPRERRLKVIEATYVAVLVLGLAIALALWWGAVPAAVAARLGVPAG